MSLSVKAQRRSLRTLMRARRCALSQQQQWQAARRICQQANCHAALLSAQHIALYHSFDGEIETRFLCHQLWQQQKQLYLPQLHPIQVGVLQFVPYHPNTVLKRNRFGILEPIVAIDADCSLRRLDVVLIPLVAFDGHCNRLGMGGGYYDRTLGNYRSAVGKPYPCHTIGLAHDCQQVESLPQATWDLRLSAVITPQRLFSI